MSTGEATTTPPRRLPTQEEVTYLLWYADVDAWWARIGSRKELAALIARQPPNPGLSLDECSECFQAVAMAINTSNV